MDERDEDTRRWIVEKLIDAGALSGECGFRYHVENRAAAIYHFIKSGRIMAHLPKTQTEVT